MPNLHTRIRKLLALSASSNEHEAALAARTAARMMDEHRLTLADFPAFNVADFASPVIGWQAKLATIVGTRLGVVTVAGRVNWHYAGYAVDTSGALQLYTQLCPRIQAMADAAWTAHEQELTDPVLGRYPSLDEPGARDTWIASFAMGCVSRVYAALDEDRSTLARSTALARIRFTVAEEVQQYAEQRFGPLQKHVVAHSTETLLLPGAMKQGGRAWGS